MTAAIYRSTPSLSIPQTQNTAPVLEFACLYTHDLRKKTKRWNDGSLRYHTFNKRAMVYDVPRNFVGDMHWTGDDDMQEGDEVVLEKAGVRVQVAERIGETKTDLSELRVKKGTGANGDQSRRVERVDPRVATPIAKASSGSVARGNTQLKHKSLNALLGTPKGQMGKATLPTKSPFEERQANVENEEAEGGRPVKRMRVAGMVTSKMATKQASAPPWARTVDSTINWQQQPPSKVFIDLSDDVTQSNDLLPGFSSDALAPSSPVRAAAKDSSGEIGSPALQIEQPAAISSLASARGKPRVPRIQEIDQEREETADVPARQLSKSCESPHSAKQPPLHSSKPPSTRPAQTLRLASSAPKKRTLLCQGQLKSKPQRKPISSPEGALKKPSIDVDLDGRPQTAKERVEERLRQINMRKARNTTAESNVTSTTSLTSMAVESNHDPGMMSRSLNETRPPAETSSAADDKTQNATRASCQILATTGPPGLQPSRQRHDMSMVSDEISGLGKRFPSEDSGRQSSHEVSAIEIARWDRMMLPPAAPLKAPTPPLPVPPPREARLLQRVISEPPTKAVSKTVNDQAEQGSKRVPGAPIRYTPTPSPTKSSREATSVLSAEKEARMTFKNKSKKTLQKSVSLNMTAAGTSTVILGRPFQAPGKPQNAKVKKPDPPPEDVGPWSREAFDLFKWRPPGWDEEKWCVVEAVEEAGGITTAPARLSGGASLPSILKVGDKNS